MRAQKRKVLLGDIFGVFFAIIIFIVPFVFMFVNSLKDRRAANKLQITLPTKWHLENYLTVLTENNHMVITAFKNSLLLAFFSVLLLVITCSMSGYILQRRSDKVMKIFSAVILAGLMVPPAIIPTISMMQHLHVYKTLFGMTMVEVALQTPFTIMLYRGFMNTIPIELEEAGYIDGCSNRQMFTDIVFPLLKPVTATVVILNAVNVFNDFTNPLYFLPGAKNATVQLTLYTFMGQYSSSYNLLFADVIVITIPMLILFIFFNRKIVDGMVAGAVKG
jgi:raffinose/stachyose/melibiose transport system permease protein